ncbi:hypothetical protein KIH41_13275 [Litoribacter ruber]|uniref:hypothetical protein n=1 Tax=Litoribacter ruber TaxID=702568 RepID=UPI001BD9FC13|nr:hypothetical protein [Litoribacter ruber]MBT0812251.1 hypothetical protein [Litoribacter ruber]
MPALIGLRFVLGKNKYRDKRRKTEDGTKEATKFSKVKKSRTPVPSDEVDREREEVTAGTKVMNAEH